MIHTVLACLYALCIYIQMSGTFFHLFFKKRLSRSLQADDHLKFSLYDPTSGPEKTIRNERA